MLNIQNDALPDRNASFVQSMLDASMHGIALLEPVRDEQHRITDFRVMAANASILPHIGIEPSDATGKLISDIFPEYKNTGFFQLYLIAIESRQLQRKELYYEDKRIQGWFDLGVAPHEDMLVITFVNITETKQYQQAIQEYESAIELLQLAAARRMVIRILLLTDIERNRSQRDNKEFLLSRPLFRD